MQMSDFCKNATPILHVLLRYVVTVIIIIIIIIIML